MAYPLRVNAAELLRRPGSEKTIDLQPTVAEIGLHDERFRESDTVEVHLRLESLTDGIVVNGEVTAPWYGICRRCATAATGTLTARSATRRSRATRRVELSRFMV